MREKTMGMYLLEIYGWMWYNILKQEGAFYEITKENREATSKKKITFVKSSYFKSNKATGKFISLYKMHCEICDCASSFYFFVVILLDL